jgi:hypothetical protein
MSKKEELLKKLWDINHEYYDKVMDREAQEDSIGRDSDHLYKALRYVPNRVIKDWIKELKGEIKRVQNYPEE